MQEGDKAVEEEAKEWAKGIIDNFFIYSGLFKVSFDRKIAIKVELA